jgi:hypothetical protein
VADDVPHMTIAEAMFLQHYLAYLMVAEKLGLTLEDVRQIEAEVRAEREQPADDPHDACEGQGFNCDR